MKRAWVTVPFAGSASIELELEDDTNDATAVALALDAIEMEVTPRAGVELNGWDLYSKLLEGNVVYVDTYRAVVEWDEDES